MKKIITSAFSMILFCCILSCNQALNQIPNQNNPDSIKKVIIALNDESYRSFDNPEKYQSFCEDSMLVVRDDVFMTSAYTLAHDLPKMSVYPHDYTFKLFGNTAMLSYLWSGYELINNDTIFSSYRNLRTFAFINGKWKVVGSGSGKESITYFKPIEDKNQSLYASYTGVYKVSPGVFDTLFVKENKLYDKQTGSDAAIWFPINGTDYMNQNNLDRFSIGKDSKGKVAYYTVMLPDGQKYRCPKIN